MLRLSAMEQWFSKRGFRTKYSAQAGNRLDILSVESAQVGQKCQAWVGHRAVCLHTKSLGCIYHETMPRLAEPPLPSLTTSSHQAKGRLASVPQASRDPGVS